MSVACESAFADVQGVVAVQVKIERIVQTVAVLEGTCGNLAVGHIEVHAFHVARTGPGSCPALVAGHSIAEEDIKLLESTATYHIPAADELAVLVDGSACHQLASGFCGVITLALAVVACIVGAHVAFAHLWMLRGIVVDVGLQVFLRHDDRHIRVVAKGVLVLALWRFSHKPTQAPC